MRKVAGISCIECESVRVDAHYDQAWILGRLSRLNSGAITLKIGEETREAAPNTVLFMGASQMRSSDGREAWQFGVIVHDRPVGSLYRAYEAEDLGFLEAFKFLPKSCRWMAEPEPVAEWGRMFVVNPDGTSGYAQIAV